MIMNEINEHALMNGKNNSHRITKIDNS